MKIAAVFAIVVAGLALSACAPRYYYDDRYDDGYHGRYYGPPSGYYGGRDRYYGYDHYYDRDHY